MSLFNDQIPLMKPWLGDEEWLALKDVILGGWISQGPKVQEFEQKTAAFLGVRHAVAVNACTSAMHLAMKIAGVRSGDEIILSDYTCMADVNAVLMAGGVPVFVDIDSRTFNMDANLVEEKISEKTKVILSIDQIGLANDLDKIKKIADRHKIVVVDDAATAFGGKYKNKFLGSNGFVTTFSFHPRKMITTGEGGMLVTDNEQVAENARILRATGASVSDLERHKAKGMVLQKYYDSGYNYRMTDIQATLGIVQLSKAEEIIRIRREQAELYSAAFSGMEELTVPFVPEYATHAWSSYCLTLNPNSKYSVAELLSKMAAKNISCRFGIQPLHQEPFFENRNFKDIDYPESCRMGLQTFFIPIYPGLKVEEQQFIIKSLKSIFSR